MIKKITLSTLLLCGSGLVMAEEVTPQQVPEKTQSQSETGATATQLEPMQIRAAAPDVGYAVTNSSMATKTDTPIMETPFSIQVVSEEVMNDQQAYRLEDVLKNVSNVRVLGSPYSSAYENIQSRGFRAEPFRDGVRVMFLTTPLANAERVEVLKGPAAIQYGRVEPGGMVNVVTKKPLDTPYYALEQQFGSYDFSRTTADLTGPINADKTLLYRFNAEYLDKDSFVDYTFNRREFYAPSLTWRPSDQTNFTLSYEYRDEHELGATGVPAVGDRPANVDKSSFYGEPGLQNQFKSDAFNFTAEHQFNEQWTVRGGAGTYRGNYKYQSIVNGGMIDDVSMWRWGLGSDYDHRNTDDANLDLQGKFNISGVQHTALFGTDYHRFRNYGNWIDWTIPDINIHNPVYGQVNKKALMASPPTSFYDRTDRWNGYYLQDQMTIADRWHLLIGGRYDVSKLSNGYAGIYGTGSSMSDAKANAVTNRVSQFSPRLGATYEASSWLSLYGSYTEAVGGTNDTRLTATGGTFDPESSEQYEIGAKTEFFAGRLNASVALYELTKDNIATADPSNPNFSLPIGEARSRGVEFDISGRLSSSLSIIASYAYNDTTITKSNPDGFGDNIQGNDLPNVPRSSGSVWLKYDFLDETLAGLSVGGGVFAAGQAEGDTANTFKLPGYARLDAYAAYQFKVQQRKLTAQLNVNNLLDKTYYISGQDQSRSAVFVAEPLMVMGSVKLEF